MKICTNWFSMNSIDEYTDRIRRSLLALSDEATKEKTERLISGARCIGVAVPNIRQLAKDLKPDFGTLPFETLCRIVDQLFESECREEILLAVFVLAQRKKELANIPWTRISPWLDHLDNWETCDQLSTVIALLIPKNPSLLTELYTLAESPNKWKRRFAAATAANINHNGCAYPEETFRIVRPLLADREVVVSKAVGWALRGISKKCPSETFGFLKENLGVIPKRLLKESSELLPEKEKKELTVR